jgi:3-methylfumaryl-CoA hydratase
MTSSHLNLEHLRDWIGRSEVRHDTLHPNQVAALAATLDRQDPSDPGSEVPPLWHWCYFTPLTPQSEIGEDGHAKRGGFLPPVPLPRRMWAGGRLKFMQPLLVGQTLSRTSTIDDVTIKQGRSGNLVFVKVRHEFAQSGQAAALVEEHDIVYRDAPTPGAPAPAPTDAPANAQFSRAIKADEVLLFRYSALTFNGHRIHYDRAYVTQVEGYPGLIVHGPLIATLLVDLVRRELPAAHISAFEFKAVRPIFDIHPFSVNGRVVTHENGSRSVQLWAADHEGYLAMQATATLSA